MFLQSDNVPKEQFRNVLMLSYNTSQKVRYDYGWRELCQDEFERVEKALALHAVLEKRFTQNVAVLQQEPDISILPCPRCLIAVCYRRYLLVQIRCLTLEVTLTSLKITFSCRSICSLRRKGSSDWCCFLSVSFSSVETCFDVMSLCNGVLGLSYVR